MLITSEWCEQNLSVEELREVVNFQIYISPALVTE